MVILQRNESANRKLLDAVELVEAPKRFNNLEIHYCDEFEDAIYPELLYYVINKNIKLAYRVDDLTYELVEARIIRKFPKHTDKDELDRHFKAFDYTLTGELPEGNDLFRTV
jgi:hypothetical protein